MTSCQIAYLSPCRRLARVPVHPCGLGAATAGPGWIEEGQPAAEAAPAEEQPLDEFGDEDGEEIVVTGQRPRGSVIGDIPPENTLDARDVRATGATDINELLEALAPQIGSARGRGGERPITAAQRPAHLQLPRASRHPDRSDPAGRDPARGSRAQIRLPRRPAGREHHPARALPLDRRARRRRRTATEGGYRGGARATSPG